MKKSVTPEVGINCCPTCGQKVKPAKASSTETWSSYSAAYRKRYGIEPLRNATVNSQLSAFVARVGIEAAPQVAAFYVAHNDRFYVQKQHPVGILLKDAEGLHTQWASGKSMTQTTARQIEATQSNRDAHDETMAILAAKGRL